jgi:hypothetical protein
VKVAQRDQIAQSVQQKTTEELLAIWDSNDRNQWSDTTFEVIKQTLSEREVVIPPQVASENQPCVADTSLERYRGVKGWLLFLCIGLTVLTPLRIIGEYGAAGMDIESIRGISFDGLFNLAFAGFSIYVGVCLWRVWLGAVKKAKVFLWCVVALNAIIALLAFKASLQPSADVTIVRTFLKCVASAIIAAVWISYLHTSKRVKGTYAFLR